jgi:porin
MDGVPGDPANEKGTHIRFKSTDGLLTTVQVGIASVEDKPYYHAAIGTWGYSKAVAGTDKKNQGAYIFAEGTVFHEDGDLNQGLNIFGRYGVAADEINAIGSYTGAGIVYTGLIPGRNEDSLGVAVAIASPTDALKDAAPGVTDSETSIEICYSARITPWLVLKPDVQLIKNPGLVTNTDDATVVGVRVELSF